MRRGFKAEAERTASQLRRKIGQTQSEQLDLRALASELGAELRAADELVAVDKLRRLDRTQPGAFSACTFTIGERHVVVYSPLSSDGRRNSDVAHELAHLVLEHEVKVVHKVGGLNFFSCDPEEEQEANWLAGCLLLPRSLLVAAVRRGKTAAEIAEEYEVSEQMAAFRLRTTGVLRQVAASRSRG